MLSYRMLLWFLSFFAAAFIALFISSLIFVQLAPQTQETAKAGEKNLAPVPTEGKQNPYSKSSEPVLGQAKTGLMKNFEWPSDAKLRMDALVFFSGRNDWPVCLYVAGLMDATELPLENSLKFADSYYEKIISRILSEELAEERAALGDGGTVLGQGGDLSSLPLSQAMLLLDRLRNKMSGESVPQPVADILMQAFVRERGDAFQLAMLCDMIALPPGPRRSYSEAESFLKSCLDSNPRYWELRMGMHCAEFARCIEGLPDATRTWILRGAQKNSQAKAFQKAVRNDTSSLSLKAYSELAPVHRWLLAQRLSASFSASDRNVFFKAAPKGSSVAAYRDAVNEDLNKAPSMLCFLRQNPNWISALNAQDYGNALSLFEKDYLLACDLLPDPKLCERVSQTLKLERRLWKQLMARTDWKRFLDEATGGKLEMRDKIFMSTLQLFLPPPSMRNEAQTGLLALCFMNRGEDPRYLHIKLDTKKDIIKKYLPEREINGD
ncbi:MAG: hypothetical protein A2X49_16045 [Lentisphaerae bacterium GWF2_52_8]|nr:MAG: hypothetical protein A2X49_16045 [Lentisphaerae bacterium GWF2_52_8]